jgi:hypothetical protein
MINPILKKIIVVLAGIIIFLVANYLMESLATKLGYENTINITFQTEVLEDDIFQIYYKNEFDKGFSGIKSVKKEVTGNSFIQDVEFEIPLDSVSTIRLDIGENSNQKSIYYDNIIISRYNEEFRIASTDLLEYFNPNGFIDIDTTNQLLKTKTRNDLWSPYDPFLTSKNLEEVFSEMSNISQPKGKFHTYIALLFTLCFLLYFLIYYPKYNGLATISNVYSYILISCFLLMLMLPALFVKNELQNTNSENRILSVKPELNWESILSFPASYDNYYSDNFGLRENLVSLLSYLKVKVFNESSVPDKVIIGQKGWMYLWGDFYKIKQDYTRENLHSPTELKKIFNSWVQTQNQLNKDGIRHYITFYPNKHTVYPEYLPYRIKLLQKDTVSRADQILNYHKETNSSLNILDIRSKLINEKKVNFLYHKHDSHWNDFGAFLAYRELIPFISNGLEDISPVKSKLDYNISIKNETGGGLLKALGLEGDSEFMEENPHFESKEVLIIQNGNTKGFPARTIIDINNNAMNKTTALFFRDSFTIALRPFISQHFYKTIYIWGGYDYEIVKKIKPDIVVEGNVERYFSSYIVK